MLLRFAPGPHRAADIAAFSRAMAPFCATIQQPTCVVTDQRPNGVTNYARIDATPEVLAGILAVLGLAVLGQFIVASARRRRRDFAILKTLGLLRRQLTAVTAWQVTTLTLLALLVGLPAGRGRRPLGLGAVRRPGRALHQCHYATSPGDSHPALRAARGQRHHLPGRAVCRPPEPRGRAALRVAPG